MQSRYPLSPDPPRDQVVLAVEWLEQEGRPLTSGAESLASFLGGGEGTLVAGLDELLTPARRRQIDETLRAADGQDGAPVDLGDIDLTLGFREPRWFHFTVQVEPNPDGPDRCTGQAVDLGAALHVERALVAKSEQLELVIEGTRLGTWDWNPQTGALQFNARWAEILGHELCEIPAELESWESRVHPDDLERTYADITDHIEGRTEFYENIHRMRHKDGSWVYILDRGKVVRRDADGNAIRFTGTHTDITPQKEAEIAAQHAADSKSLFLATMSHEIRTPLNGVLGLLQVLQGTTLSDEQRELTELATQSGEHLLVLINDILDLSKIEAGQMAITAEATDVAQLVRSIAGLFSERARDRRIDLRVDVDLDRGSWFETDPHRLHQVLANLLSNAIKFTSEGSVAIEVTANRSGADAELVFAVSDTGKGIADTAAIWEGFRQEEANISRQFGGTGLGLTISKRLVELFGGSIGVESAVGVGSRFEVRFPARPAAPPCEPEQEGADRKRLSRLRVLVADDNPINRRVAEGMLKRLGLSLQLAADGREAIERCRSAEFDLVLMDLHMPEVDGLEATRVLKREFGGRCPRIVACTADVSEQSLHDCDAVGFDDFIEKPFALARLERVLFESLPDAA